MYFCMQTSFAFAYTITQQVQTVRCYLFCFILLCVFFLQKKFVSLHKNISV